MKVPALLAPADLELELPSSKSEANRALIAAALNGGRWRFEGLEGSEDVEALLSGLRAFGFRVSSAPDSAGGSLEELTLGPGPRTAIQSATLDCGAAGTALRFLLSLAAILPGEWTLAGTPRLLGRPLEPLLSAWRQLGVAITHRPGEPVHVRGGCSAPNRPVSLEAGLSSQFLSALLLVGAELSPAGLELELSDELTSPGYAALTARVLERFGVEVRSNGPRWSVRRRARPPGADYRIGADWSAFGAFHCLAAATGSALRSPGLHSDSGQPDEGFGAFVERLLGPGALELDFIQMPDQFINAAVLAARRSDRTRLVGAKNLRSKESDRLAVTAAHLAALGADVRELPDGLELGPRPKNFRPARLDCAEDHRIAMGFALFGLLEGGVELSGEQCVSKSYPRFFEQLGALRHSTRPVALVGQRGAGKSTLGRALAQASGARFLDTDALFAAAHGPIGGFVELAGWERFRDEEQRLIGEAIAPGRLLALGGGALEREATRKLLRERALLVWIDVPIDVLRARLSLPDNQRPAVLGGSLLEELEALETRRRPLFESAAAVRIDGREQLDDQVRAAIQGLHAAGRQAATGVNRE